jgi:hypothetical protein
MEQERKLYKVFGWKTRLKETTRKIELEKGEWILKRVAGGGGWNGFSWLRILTGEWLL